ncbi:hypothetical protein CHCC20441_2047 [Bacillus licheniformis]|uniref:Uncharacterized protein n=1 Tax=Bacillus licheniformis TaxID=1402 RepID=A0A8B5YHR5_BACLI|nr:hypothetical protein MUY_003768 [Bacillus licheniformis WX-02]KYC97921.1 hypothetical protein B4164_3708 [Bacillus licheniformis]TWN10807.1 hypothetical protein CHCC14564_3359 [Bacillus licheniformis LMG 17339]TWN84071.1 hypothetical protein CHCC20491_3978 [Bacillus paralicheniformis]OLG04137.1 hypothetical protein B4124_2057 [Bacillus licheniformis]
MIYFKIEEVWIAVTQKKQQLKGMKRHTLTITSKYQWQLNIMQT